MPWRRASSSACAWGRSWLEGAWHTRGTWSSTSSDGSRTASRLGTTTPTQGERVPGAQCVDVPGEFADRRLVPRCRRVKRLESREKTLRLHAVQPVAEPRPDLDLRGRDPLAEPRLVVCA